MNQPSTLVDSYLNLPQNRFAGAESPVLSSREKPTLGDPFRQQVPARSAARPKVMIIDGTTDARATASFLEREGFAVIEVPDGDAAIDRVEAISPVAVLLDLDLPGTDGFETCRQLRTHTTAHLVLVTDRSDDVAKITGFATGADDYLTKPVPFWEISARLRAVVRRSAQTVRPSRVVTGPLSLDLLGRTATVSGAEITLTRIEFDLLAALARNPGVALRRSELFEAAWGNGWIGSQHLLQVHLGNLRRKLRDAGAPTLVCTVRNIGYKISAAA